MKKYKNNTLKSSKGITLIALVVTIIVLLILAGISISMLSGDNGILQRATDAKELTGIAQEKEIVALAYNSALAKKISNGDSTAVTAGDLNLELTNQGASADGNSSITVTFTDSKRVYIINNGNISEYISISNIILDNQTLEIEVNEEAIISATILPTNAMESLNWISSDESVATVSTNGSTVTVTGKKEGLATITATNGTINASCEVTVSVPKLSARYISNNAQSFYGSVVKYGVNIDTSLKDCWKIFYADQENIFLIADGYVVNTSLPLSSAKLTKSTSGTSGASATYSAYWNSIPTAQTVTESLKDSFMWSNWTNYTGISSARCISTMLNTTNWNYLVNNYADYAIGGPTLEMFCESWNAKGYTELFCNKKGTYGYYLGLSNPPSSGNAFGIQSYDGSSDLLYVPSRKTADGRGYYLSSPCGQRKWAKCLCCKICIFYKYTNEWFLL